MIDKIFKRAIRDIAIYFPSKVFPALISLVTIPIYARLFQPEEYGILSVINVFITAGSITVGNWLTSSVLRFLPFYRINNLLSRFFSTLFFALVLSITTFLIFCLPINYFLRFTVNDKILGLLPLAAFIISISCLFNILQTILRTDQKAKQFVFVELSNISGGLTVGLILVLYFGFNVEGILWGSAITMLIVSLYILKTILYDYNVNIGISHISKKTLKNFASYGLPGGVATIGTWLLSVSDRYIIEISRGTAEVGIYSMSYSISDKSINLVVSSLMLAISPILINTWESENRKFTSQLLEHITRLTLVLVIPMVAGLSILGIPIFQVLTTEKYLAGVRLIPWIASGSLLYGLSLLAYTGLILKKKTITMARNYLLAGGANVALNLLLVPKIGYLAAAVNTSISYAILLTLNIYSVIPFLPWPFPWKTLFRVSLAASGMGFVLFFLSKLFIQPYINLIACTLVGVVLYGVFLLLSGEFSEIEKESILSLIKQVKIMSSRKGLE